MARTEIDTAIGGGDEIDLNKKLIPQTGKDRVDDIAEDDLLPVKGVPMKDTPKPFVIKGA